MRDSADRKRSKRRRRIPMMAVPVAGALGLVVIAIAGAKLGENTTRDAPGADTGALPGWPRDELRGTGVAVSFPGAPSHQDHKLETPCGAMDARALAYVHQGSEYVVTAMDMPYATRSDVPGMLDRYQNLVLRDGHEEPDFPISRRVLSQRDFEMHGYPAREVRAEGGSPPVSMAFRIVVAGQRYITQSVSRKGTEPLPADRAARFFDSLEIAPDPGDTSPAAGLLAARLGFTTALIPNSYEADGPAPAPKRGAFDLVRYQAPVGALAAYVSPDPRDGKKHPAMLWAHGGFGGLGESASAYEAYREAGIVVMRPSWRGENDNPGKFELFYGEVDDLLAARDHLASLPYVDPERIYVGGHSTGGTLTLLLAESTDKFRAAFSFGGAPNVGRVVADGKGYGNTPFDCRSRIEARLRSPIHFVSAIKRPTFYFEGEQSSYPDEALAMKKLADTAGVPFSVAIVKGGDHFDILDPLTRMVAKKIAADTDPAGTIGITDEEVQQAYAGRRR